MQKFKGSCRTLGRIRPRIRKVLPIALFQDWGIPKWLLIRKYISKERDPQNNYFHRAGRPGRNGSKCGFIWIPRTSTKLWLRQIIQRINLVFTCSLFPTVIASSCYAQKPIIFASLRLLSYITVWQGEEGGVGRDKCTSSFSPRVNLKSWSPALALNTDISCLLALPIKSLLIFLACVYSLDKH